MPIKTFTLNIMHGNIPLHKDKNIIYRSRSLCKNIKDISLLSLIFALFAGLVGTAFSVLIRLELSGPGVQYIAFWFNGNIKIYNIWIIYI